VTRFDKRRRMRNCSGAEARPATSEEARRLGRLKGRLASKAPPRAKALFQVCTAVVEPVRFELVQKISPILEQLHSLFPISGPVVHSAHLVWVKMGKRSFDNVIVVVPPVQNGRTAWPS
jgi:hypothetical protein